MSQVKRRGGRTIAFVLLGIIVLVLPFLLSRQYIHLFNLLGISAVGAVALRLLLLAGRLSLGQSFFLLVGAYVSGIFAVKLEINPWLCFVVAPIVSAFIAFVVGFVLLKVPGVYFAVASLALVMVSQGVISAVPELTGGTSGLTGIPGFAIGTLNFGSRPILYYYTMLFLAAVSLVTMYRIEHSPLGLLVRSLGQNDELADHLGVSPQRYRLLVFTTGALFTGAMGAFYTTYLHFISPEAFGLNTALYLQIYAVVGGLASFWGPVLGVVFIEGLIHFLGVASWIQPLIYGTILVVFFILVKGGVITLPGMARGLFRRISGRGSAPTSTTESQTH